MALNELMRMIIIFMSFCLKHCWFFKILFFRFKKMFSSFLLAISNLQQLGKLGKGVDKGETMTFSPYLIPPEFGKAC